MAKNELPKYEYLVYQADTLPEDNTLTEFGKDGWKVVTHVVARNGKHIYTLERPIRSGRS